MSHKGLYLTTARDPLAPLPTCVGRPRLGLALCHTDGLDEKQRCLTASRGGPTRKRFFPRLHTKVQS
jgi:hypothetical protein